MTVSNKLRNIFVTTLAFAIFAMPIFTQAQQNDAIFDLVPEDSLFCIRINNLNDSMNQLDKFILNISPITSSLLVNQQLPALLGSPELAGLNMDGSFAAFGVLVSTPEETASGMITIFPGILAPVTNYDEFIKGLANTTPADDNGIVKMQSIETVLISKIGNYALMTWASEYDNLIKYKNMMTTTTARPTTLNKVFDASEAKLATSEPIWIHGNIQQAVKSFGPMLNIMIEGMKSQMTNLPASAGASQAEIKGVMDMYTGILDTVMKEAKSISLSINPKADSLNITNTISAVSGTSMAKMFTSDSSAKANNLLPYLEDGSVVNFAFSMNSPLVTESLDLQYNLISMLGDNLISKEDIQNMKSITQEMLDCIDGPIAYTFSENPGSGLPIKGKYIIAVKDEKKFQDTINKSIEMMTNSSFFEIYEQMGMEAKFTIERNVETYKGVSLDKAIFSMNLDDADLPQEAQMVKAFYAEGIEYHWGVTNGLFAAAIGNDSDKTIHDLIDQIQSGQAKQVCAETKAAMALIPGSENSDFFVTMNAIRLIKMGIGMSGSMLPMQLPDIDIETKSNIVIAGKADNGKMTIQLAIPKEHIQEIMMAIMTLQQQMTPMIVPTSKL